MRIMRPAVPVLAVVALVAPALAQTPKPTSTRGECAKLTVAGNDATAACEAKLTAMTLPDGTTFLIFGHGKTLIGFSGAVSETVRSGATTSWPVRFVNIGAPGREPSPVPAQGQCRSARGTTACTATTGQGAFEGVFKASQPAR